MDENTRVMQKKETETPEGVERTRPERMYTPAVDILERKDDIIMIADMPGVDEKSVDITLEKNVLTIFGKVEAAALGDHRLLSAEYGVGSFQRAFTITDDIDRDRIQALVKNGVLRLTLPRAATAKTRKIAVAAA